MEVITRMLICFPMKDGSFLDKVCHSIWALYSFVMDRSLILIFQCFLLWFPQRQVVSWEQGNKYIAFHSLRFSPIFCKE